MGSITFRDKRPVSFDQKAKKAKGVDCGKKDCKKIKGGHLHFFLKPSFAVIGGRLH